MNERARARAWLSINTSIRYENVNASVETEPIKVSDNTKIFLDCLPTPVSVEVDPKTSLNTYFMRASCTLNRVLHKQNY